MAISTSSVEDSQSDHNQEVTQHTWPDPRYAWYVVFLLMLIYMFSFLDRTIIVLLIEPIKADLGLSDTQISLLYGFAFAVFYTFLGIPIARLADRKNRRLIIAIGVAVWSLMTALCGLSKNFIQLFAARVGVGVGEAALSPAAYSLISDYFPEKKRAKAMSVYTMAVYLGGGLALLLGGLIIAMVRDTPTVELPIIGELRSWQVTFMAVGFPGLIFFLLMFTIKEPARHEMIAGQEKVPLMEAFRYFSDRWRFYIVFCLGMACLVMYSYSLTAWTPSFFIRTFGWDAVEVAQRYGMAMLIFGPTGILAGGWIATRMAEKGDLYANVRIGIFAFALLIIPAATMTTVGNPWVALGITGVVKFFSGLPVGVAVAALHSVTPNQLRAQSVALYMFSINILGLGLGPLFVALLTDYLFADEMALRYSLAIIGVSSCVIGLMLVIFSLKTFKNLRSQFELD